MVYKQHVMKDVLGSLHEKSCHKEENRIQVYCCCD